MKLVHNRLLNCLIFLCFILLQNTSIKADVLLHPSKVNHTFILIQEKEPAGLSFFSCQDSLPKSLAFNRFIIDGDDDSDTLSNSCYFQVSKTCCKMHESFCSIVYAVNNFSPIKSILHSALLFRICALRI